MTRYRTGKPTARQTRLQARPHSCSHGLRQGRQAGQRASRVIGISIGAFVALTLVCLAGMAEDPVQPANEDALATNPDGSPEDRNPEGLRAGDPAGDRPEKTATPGGGDDDASGKGETDPTPLSRAVKAAEPPVQLSTVDTSSSGPFDALGFSAASQRVRLGSFEAPLREVVMISFDGARLPPATVVLYLSSGSELFVRPVAGDETDVRFESAVLTTSDGTRTLSVPIEQVRALAVPRHFETEARFHRFRLGLPGYRRGPIYAAGGPRPVGNGEPASEPTPEEPGEDDTEAKDVVLTLEESKIEGLVTSIGAGGLNFEAETLGKVKLGYQKICALTIAALDDDKPATDDAKLGVDVTFQDGSFLVATLVALGDGVLKLQSPELGLVSTRLEHVRSIEVRGGRTQYLADLSPIGVITSDALFTPRPAQRDANVLGGRLRIRGRSFRKGIGMLSKSRVTYRLDGNCDRFRAVLGMDDEAIPQSLEAELRNGGTADFRILLDDKVALEKTLSFRDEPMPVDLSVAGAKTLSLEVDYGPGFLVLDYADWADARLILK